MSTSVSALQPAGGEVERIVLELFRAESAAEPHRFEFKTQPYLRRLKGGELRTAVLPWEGELVDALLRISGTNPSREATRRLGEILQAWLRGLDWAADEAKIKQAIEAGRPIDIVLRFAAAELFALPWELVTLGESNAPLGELPGTAIRYAWPGTETAKRADETTARGGRILFAWSTAGGQVPVEEHRRALSQASKEGHHRFDPAADEFQRASYRKLSEALAAAVQAKQPFTVLHLLCHGGRVESEQAPIYGMVLGGEEEGDKTVLDGATLARLLRRYAEHVRLVVLSACRGADPGALGNHLGSVAQELHCAGIEAVVASRFPLDSEASHLMAEALYRSLLVELHAVDAAVGEARGYMQRRLPTLDHLALQLYAREEDQEIRPFVIQPYRGLETFGVEHARFFFGREELTKRLMGKLRAQHAAGGKGSFLAIIGASGSGKSSIAQAGLIHELQKGELPGSGRWPVMTLRPGERPLESLAMAAAAVLGSAAPPVPALVDELRADEQRLHGLIQSTLSGSEDTKRIVVFVDQFEEVFTLCADDRAREALIDNLLGAASGRSVVLLTMRADFYGKCGAYPRLAAMLSDHQELVGTMTADELRQAIEEPAHLVGMKLEPGLTELLIEHVKERPGALPLLQHALARLWEQRQDWWLTSDAYQAMGGLAGALDQHASHLYAKLPDEQKAVCQRIFLRLVQPGEGTEDTRRRASWEELGESKAAADVIAVLADARLLTTGGEEAGERYVDISHEVLIRGWSRLRDWIDENREWLRIQHRLAAAAKEWDKRQGHEDAQDYLYRGARLAEVEEWSQRKSGELTALERRFIEASLALRDQEAKEREERQQRDLEMARALAEEQSQRAEAEAKRAEEQKQAAERLKRRALQAGGVGLIALVLAVTAFMFFRAARSAQGSLEQANVNLGKLNTNLEASVKQANERLALMNASNGVNARDREEEPLKALHYFTRAATQDPNPQRRKSWRFAAAAMAGNMRLRDKFEHKGMIVETVRSSDGRLMLLTWSHGMAMVWDAESGRAVSRRPMSHKAPLEGAAFSRDKRWVLTWSDGTAMVWDAESGQAVSRRPMSHQNRITKAALSEDNRRVLTASADGTAIVWETESGQQVSRKAMRHQEGVRGVAFSKDARRVLTWSWDGTAIVWETESGQQVSRKAMRHQEGVQGAAFSRDARRVLTWGGDGTAMVWEAESGKAVSRQPMKHKEIVLGAAFSGDERRVLTWSEDGTAMVWEAESGKAVSRPMKHKKKVRGAAFNGDERRVLTWSEDGTAMVWEAESGKAVSRPMKHKEIVLGAAFSGDGRRVLTWSWDGTARIWDATSGQPISVFMQHKYVVIGAMFIVDERRVLTWSEDGTVMVWEAESGKALGVGVGTSKAVSLQPIQYKITGRAALSGDGRRVLTWSEDGTVMVWEAESGKEVSLQPIRHHAGPIRAALSGDGRRVLTWSEDGMVMVWEAESGKAVSRQPISHNVGLHGAALSEDGRRVLTWSWDGTAMVWEAEGATEVSRQPTLHKEGITDIKGAAFSRDARRVLTWGGDGRAMVWEAESGKAVSRQPMQHTSAVVGAAFSRNERRVLTWSWGGTAMVWEAESGEAVSQQPIEHKKVLIGSMGIVRAAFSRNDRRVLTWGVDGTAMVWEVESGKAVSQKPMQHKGRVKEAVFSGDERQVLTWSEDGTAMVWEAESGKAVSWQPMEHEGIMGAALSRDESQVLTWSTDGVQVWDAISGQLLSIHVPHETVINIAAWSWDENRVLIWSDKATSVWELPVESTWPEESLVLRREVETGTRLDDVGEIEVIPAEEWHELKRKYDEIARKHGL